MDLNEIKTPAFILNLDCIEHNIKRFQEMCNDNNKLLVPMLKTHKSIEITKMQVAQGATEFLVGTLDEAIEVSNLNIKRLTLAYPFLGSKSLNTIHHCIQNGVQITLSIDSLEVAKLYNDYFRLKGLQIEYLLIINTGLNRLGIKPIEVGNTVDYISKHYKYLKFRGISTHPGQVYKEDDKKGVINVSQKVEGLMKEALHSLKNYKIEPEIIATGATPTFEHDLHSIYNTLRPGNYVFNDMIQVGLGVARIEDCALTVLSRVISHPDDDTYVIDCGSKALGLDTGAHGNKMIKGYGHILGSTNLEIVSLSEEVGVIKRHGHSNLKVGDVIQIVPNHSCKTCNMTSYLIGVRENKIANIIKIDMRGNSKHPME